MNNSPRTLELSSEAGFVAGRGIALESLNATVLEIAPTNIPVLILGESGTGKDVYARLLHKLSGCSDMRFKKMSCSILEPGELSRSLARHSNADPDASPTTLFLDGIDELDPACQRALLSLLPDTQGQIGSDQRFARLISSSSRDLEGCVDSGQFRKELFFRVNGVCLRLPPLRERREDTPALIGHFLVKHAFLLEKSVPTIDPETMGILVAYDWPGNIRQLENLARKIVALGHCNFAINDLRTSRTERPASIKLPGVSSLKVAAKAASRQREREMILEALERTKWNRKRAARELQISYKALLYKLKQIGSLETGIQN